MLVDAEGSYIAFIITTIKWRAIIRCKGIWYPMCRKHFFKLWYHTRCFCRAYDFYLGIPWSTCLSQQGATLLMAMVCRSLHEFSAMNHQAYLSSAMVLGDLVFLWLDRVCSGQWYLLPCYQCPGTKLSPVTTILSWLILDELHVQDQWHVVVERLVSQSYCYEASSCDHQWSVHRIRI